MELCDSADKHGLIDPVESASRHDKLARVKQTQRVSVDTCFLFLLLQAVDLLYRCLAPHGSTKPVRHGFF